MLFLQKPVTIFCFLAIGPASGASTYATNAGFEVVSADVPYNSPPAQKSDGLFGWFSGAGIMNKVIEKTKVPDLLWHEFIAVHGSFYVHFPPHLLPPFYFLLSRAMFYLIL